MNKLICIAMLLFSAGVVAQPMLWTGDGDGISFNDTDNWDTDTKPTASNQLLIENDSVVVRSMALAYSLELDDAELTILSDLTLSNTDTFAILGAYCAIYNDGNIFINQSGNNSFDFAIELTFSTLFNQGDINIKNSTSGLQISSNSTLVNENLIVIESIGSSLRIASSSYAVNSDSIIINNVSNASNNGIVLSFASEFQNDGVIDILIDGPFSTGIHCGSTSTHFINNGDIEVLISEGRAMRVSSSGTCDLLDGDLRFIMDDDAEGVSVTSSSTLIIDASARLEIQNVPNDFWITVEEGSTLTCHGDLIME